MAGWPLVFTQRADLCLDAENTPYIESLDKIENDDDQTYNRFREPHGEDDQAESDKERDEIQEFMRGGHAPDVYLPQVKKVVDFCRGCAGVSLAALQSGKGKAHHQIVAWLDQRSRDGERSNSGPLTALDLYRRLREPVSDFNMEIPYPHERKKLTNVISASDSRGPTKTLQAPTQMRCTRRSQMQSEYQYSLLI